MSNVNSEILKRRTFGIISHPDAGKTTLTEKLLLMGGAIHVAGTVKSRKSGRFAASDFMEIEKQRGISVSSSVMGFVYNNFQVNLLDTPGHKDFSEDTYRTLTAVDSALMVIDCTKGVEMQTRKLMQVCRMRQTPILTFINKLDREGKHPIELLDEIEKELDIKVCPCSWPIGMGRSFKGVYDLLQSKVVFFKSHARSDSGDSFTFDSLDDPELQRYLGPLYATLREELELLSLYPAFDVEAYLAGSLTPVFFGSAVNNFGIQELLDCFVNIAPSPLPRQTLQREVCAQEPSFSGFIFKIHANIDPKHRDRIAFLRICSGVFERNKAYWHPRLKKKLRFANPTSFMARDKSIVDIAYPGDIVGLHDTGNFKIGDALTEGEGLKFTGIPHFSPEIFRVVVNKNPMKAKQLQKGLMQLCEEGLAQLFVRSLDQSKLLGTVGLLQFDVIQYRLAHEYGAECLFEPFDFYKACWVTANDAAILSQFWKSRQRQHATDIQDRPVYLAESQWGLDREMSENPDISFSFSSEI
ncbi:MAG: peptide chain release factor 3 [bacterium]